jgi:hypothetical protein
VARHASVKQAAAELSAGRRTALRRPGRGPDACHDYTVANWPPIDAAPHSTTVRTNGRAVCPTAAGTGRAAAAARAARGWRSQSVADECGVVRTRACLQLTYLDHAGVRRGAAEPVAVLESIWVGHEGLISTS